MATLNVYMPNNNAEKYVRKKNNTELKGKMGIATTIVRASPSLTKTDGKTRQKAVKDTHEPTSSPIDVSRTLHPTTVAHAYAFFPSTQGI